MNPKKCLSKLGFNVLLEVERTDKRLLVFIYKHGCFKETINIRKIRKQNVSSRESKKVDFELIGRRFDIYTAQEEVFLPIRPIERKGRFRRERS